MTAANVSHLPEPAPKSKKKASVAAREAEADDGHVIVEQCGLRLRVPQGGKVPLTAYMAFLRGDELGGTELLLGPEQWAAFLDKNPTIEDFTAIGKQLEEFSGN